MVTMIHEYVANEMNFEKNFEQFLENIERFITIDYEKLSAAHGFFVLNQNRYTPVDRGEAGFLIQGEYGSPSSELYSC